MSFGYRPHSTDDRKKRKRSHLDDSPDDMVHLRQPITSSTHPTHLQPPPAPSRKPSERLFRPPNEIDEFLSSDVDLELSFASTMSLNSPPASPAQALPLESTSYRTGDFAASPNAMDISPAPAPRLSAFGSSANMNTGLGVEKLSRPRAATVARGFGWDFGNHEASPVASVGSLKVSTGKRLQRAALPSEWFGQISQLNLMVSVLCVGIGARLTHSFIASLLLRSASRLRPMPWTLTASIQSPSRRVHSISMLYPLQSPPRSQLHPPSRASRVSSSTLHRLFPSPYDDP